MRVTQQTIARAAGVSITTVSFVLTGRAKAMKVSPRTIQRVHAAAERLGFTGNYHARSLALGRSRTLGLAVPGDGRTLLHRFWIPVIGGIGARAREQGYDLLLIGDRSDQSVAQSAVQFLRQRRIDGAIILPFGELDAAAWPAEAAVAGVNCAIPGHPSVTLDAAGGVVRALQHLHELGHREILYLGRKTRKGIVAEDRVRAFQAETKRLGLSGQEYFVEFDSVDDQSLEWYIARYRAAILAELQLPPAVTAVMCYNDNLGLALCSVLAERGVKVPEQISIVGFDDLSAACAIPPLTTVSHMLPELGGAAVALVIDRIEHPKKYHGVEPQNVVVQPELIVRSSTAAACKR